jgi:hypothetical protein
MFQKPLTLCALFLLPAAAALGQGGLPDSCKDGRALPFASIEVKHPIDQKCGLNGAVTASKASHLQNSVKNNFCAVSQGGLPEQFTPAMLVSLQKATHIKSGRGKEPMDRQALKDLGEEKVIRMMAFLIEAHHADLGSGESVNCGNTDEPGNDVHIAFADAPDAQECNSVTAEISPHFRPASWNDIGHFESYHSDTRQYVVNPQIASRLRSHSYRVTGQLFFDASHTPCPCGTHCSPIRASLWEIHPVYAIEVCRNGVSCQVDKDSDWMPFDAWWTGLVPPVSLQRPHSHDAHERAASAGAGQHGKGTGGSP